VTGVFCLSEPSSVGIGRYASALQTELARRGMGAPSMREATIVHVHFGNSSRLLLQIPILWRHPAVLVTVHDVVPRQKFFRRLVGAWPARLWASRATICTVHSNAAQEWLRRPARVVPHWAYSSSPSAPTSQAMPLRVGLFGIFAPHKGQEIAKAAFELLDRNLPIELVFCGHGARTASRQFKWPRIEILDSPTNEAFDHALSTVDCILSLRVDSAGESSGIVPQAMASGAVVIHTRLSARFNPTIPLNPLADTPEELAHILRGFVIEPRGLLAMRQTSWRFGQRLNFSRVFASYLSIYEHLESGTSVEDS
jgi:glycosyltransferase involved in cell wall biosynthesis